MSAKSTKHEKNTDKPDAVQEQKKTQQATISEQAHQEAIRQLEDQIQVLKDENLRLIAEMRNESQKNRDYTERQVKHAHQDLLQKLVPVLDAMDAGLSHEVDHDNPLYQGLAMTQQTLTSILTKEGIEIINPLHEEFNPDKHEALGMTPSAEHPEQTVIMVVQKGYQLHDRIIRPAKVMISKKPD